MVTDPLRTSAEVEHIRGETPVRLPTRDMLLGMTLGAICATALAAIGPGYVLETFADEMPAGFDTDGLVKLDGKYYEMNHESWVSTDPVSSSRVKKIEGGRVSYVDIATTDTGTYSTDALTSPHVQYPGIEVEQVRPREEFWFSQWYHGEWVRFASYRGNSYVTVQNNGVRVRTSQHGTCVSSAAFSIC